MDPALRAAASGMMAQQRRTEVISNNLANVNTPGFKRSRAHFEDLLYQTVQGQQVQGDPDMQTAPAIQVGRGTRLAGVQRLHLRRVGIARRMHGVQRAQSNLHRLM